MTYPLHHPSPPVHKGLGPGQRAAVFVGGPVLLILLACGGLAFIGSLGGTPSSTAEGQRPAAATGTTATPTPSPTPSRTPVVEKRQVNEVREVEFQVTRQNDASMARGTEKIKIAGVPGAKTLTYEVTYTDGVETARALVAEVVTRQPVSQVVLVGTRAVAAPAPPKQQCDPNYSGGCVPIASDVDCAGGSGNGPAYVRGPVTVIGQDIYDLDADDDGIGCE